ncbi:hypothetical protein GCM10011571_33660 [Marinithermofilum abyssi]|uniref:Uncharacterized protein n=1 Tax=Marinithermofilum abyssi TaxID=1571185 RepID=A0A8J2VK20_9BACL|nr:hypothetical protein [Marinithermofilum abyssi]GGE28801.1 hypothetical protein GCM10011571_33660 [Marinithermofilum abyssi]
MEKKQLTEAELNMRAKAYHDNHFNHVHHAYIDIAGDLVAGTLLSRIIFWFSPNKEGKSKLRVFKDGHYWLAKNRTDWWDEIRITPKQYDRAIKVLQQKNLVVKKVYKFEKDPTTHIRLNFDQLEIEVNKWINDIKQKMVNGEIDEKGRKTNSPKGKKPVVSRDKPDSSEENEPNANAEPQENQEEAPNPLGNLVFPQKGKTNSPKREKRNSPSGENDFDQKGISLTGNTYRENIQGKHTDHHHKEEEGKVVVVVNSQDIQNTQDLIQDTFGVELPIEDTIQFLRICKQHGKEISDVVKATYNYFAKKQEPIEDLMGALVHGAKKGWRENISVTLEREPLTQAVREGMKEESEENPDWQVDPEAEKRLRKKLDQMNDTLNKAKKANQG